MTTTYTVKIEASNQDQDIWQALQPSENIETAQWGPDWTAEDVARTTADNQTVADGSNWRILVWLGADADEGSDPAYVWYPEPPFARVNVVDGSIRVTVPDAEDTDLAHVAGRVLATSANVEPWGAEEDDMDRADRILADLGWTRISEWVDETGDTFTADVRSA